MRFFYGGDIHSTFSVLNAMLCAGRIERLVLEKLTFPLLSGIVFFLGLKKDIYILKMPTSFHYRNYLSLF